MQNMAHYFINLSSERTKPMRKKPVFIFNGLLESGKTSLIEEVLEAGMFEGIGTILLICCERGPKKYNEQLMEDNYVEIEYILKESEFTADKISELYKKHRPDAVFVEYNGMWKCETIYDMKWKDNLAIAQTLIAVNCMTYDVYFKNMKMIFSEQFKRADTVIFNRCTENMNQASMRRIVKSLSLGAEVVFKKPDGEMYDTMDQLPFDLDAGLIDIDNMDFGIWYLDLMENTERYEGKEVKIRGYLQKAVRNNPDRCFIISRKAMTCCENDVQTLGLVCVCQDKVPEFTEGQWAEVTAQVHGHQPKGEDRPFPLLYVDEFKITDNAEPGYVTFN